MKINNNISILLIIIIVLPLINATCDGESLTECKGDNLYSFLSNSDNLNNPALLNTIDQTELQSVWYDLEGTQQQNIIKSQNQLYDKLDANQQKELMNNQDTAINCGTCVSKFVTTNEEGLRQLIIDDGDDELLQGTLNKYFYSNFKTDPSKSIIYLEAMTGKDFQKIDEAIKNGDVTLVEDNDGPNYVWPEVCLPECFGLSNIEQSDIHEFRSTYEPALPETNLKPYEEILKDISEEDNGDEETISEELPPSNSLDKIEETIDNVGLTSTSDPTATAEDMASGPMDSPAEVVFDHEGDDQEISVGVNAFTDVHVDQSLDGASTTEVINDDTSVMIYLPPDDILVSELPSSSPTIVQPDTEQPVAQINFDEDKTQVRLPDSSPAIIEMQGQTYTPNALTGYPTDDPDYTIDYDFIQHSLLDANNNPNLIPAREFLSTIPNTATILDQLDNTMIPPPSLPTSTSTTDLETLGNLFIERINRDHDQSLLSIANTALQPLNISVSIPIPDNLSSEALQILGLTYLTLLQEEVSQGNTANFNEISDQITSDLMALILQTYDADFQTYSGFIISSIDDSYRAYGDITISNPKRIIINHGGDLVQTPDLIVAEHATMFWNLIEVGNNSILAHNVIKGSWIANLDSSVDEITAIELRPSPNHRAILHNDDVEIYMRSDSADAITIHYSPSGNITYINASSPDNNSWSVKEIYFGPLLPDNTRENYVRGSSWEMYFINHSTLQSTTTYPGIGRLNSIKGTYVANVTLRQKDCLYRYLPQEYEVAVSSYGNMENKHICFKNCANMSGENSIYVREDIIGLLSIGKLSSTEATYEGNAREVFDPNYVMMIKQDVDEYTSNFNIIYNNTVNTTQEINLLQKLNLEAKRDLSLRIGLQQQRQLYYQSALPASYTDLNDRVTYIDNDKTGQLELNFFTYITDNQRKLVLNRYSYNNVIEMNFQTNKQIDIPVETTVVVDNDIFYFLEKDLSIRPQVYSIPITFRSPDDVRNDYGSIVSTS